MCAPFVLTVVVVTSLGSDEGATDCACGARVVSVRQRSKKKELHFFATTTVNSAEMRWTPARLEVGVASPMPHSAPGPGTGPRPRPQPTDRPTPTSLHAQGRFMEQRAVDFTELGNLLTTLLLRKTTRASSLPQVEARLPLLLSLHTYLVNRFCTKYEQSKATHDPSPLSSNNAPLLASISLYLSVDIIKD